MSFFKKIIQGVSITGRIFSSVVSLGGSEVLRDAQVIYAKEYSTYEDLHHQISRLKQEMDNILQSIGEGIVSVQSSLIFCQKILSDKQLSVEQKSSNSATVEKLNSFNSSFDNLMNITSGAVLGGSIGVGAWAVVSLVGSASTGTAISTLSGVAAYNATIAWFGGGALAAGGAGMTGGMMMLGGIVAAPMIIFATKGTYAKAEKTEKESEKLKKEIVKLTNLKKQADEELKSLAIYHETIIKLNSAYIKSVQELKDTLYPFGVFSQFKHYIFRMLGKNYFSKKQNTSLEELRVLTESYLNNFKN